MLAEREMSKVELQNLAVVSPAAFTKLRKNQDVAPSFLTKIADVLNCDVGDMVNSVKADDIVKEDMRRIHIRDTIESQFEKEEMLFEMGIKTPSLFFIDEIAKYRQYDENGGELLGEYGRIFEEEYNNVLNEYLTLFDTPYQKYLRSIEVTDTHKGYFSIDKKARHSINIDMEIGTLSPLPPSVFSVPCEPSDWAARPPHAPYTCGSSIPASVSPTEQQPCSVPPTPPAIHGNLRCCENGCDCPNSLLT